MDFDDICTLFRDKWIEHNANDSPSSADSMQSKKRHENNLLNRLMSQVDHRRDGMESVSMLNNHSTWNCVPKVVHTLHELFRLCRVDDTVHTCALYTTTMLCFNTLWITTNKKPTKLTVNRIELAPTFYCCLYKVSPQNRISCMIELCFVCVLVFHISLVCFCFRSLSSNVDDKPIFVWSHSTDSVSSIAST